MARPISAVKKVRDAVANVVSKVAGGLASYFKGEPSIAVEKMDQFGQKGRMIAEKPSKDFDAFYLIHDIMANSPAVNAAVRKMAEDAAVDDHGDAAGLNFMVKVEALDEEAAESKKVAREFKRTLVRLLEDFLVRTGLGYNAKHYIRKQLYAGNCFAENHIYINPETALGRIELIRELPTFQMHVNWNERMQLVGYTQKQYRNDKGVHWDTPAQIIHWKNDACDYFTDGRSILLMLESRWESFKIIEMDLIAGIHTRAVAPEVHYLGRKTGLDSVSDDQIDEYEQQLFENPADTRRYYVVREGQTRIEFPKTGDAAALESLLNIWRSFERSFVEALGVPGIFAGEQSSARRRVAASAEQDYARRINSIRQDFSVALRPVVLLELALQGFDLTPEGLETKHGVRRVTITPMWPDLSETPTQKTDRLATEFEAGMKSLESCLREKGNADPQGEIDLIKAERAAGIWPLDKYTGAPDEGITPNGSQGRGVPKDDSAEAVLKGVPRRKLKALLAELLAEIATETED